MNREELIEKLTEQYDDTRQPAALIHDPQRGLRGVAFLLGENLSRTWQSGDLLIFWENGDHTDLGPNTEVDFWQPLFDVVEDENGDQPE